MYLTNYDPFGTGLLRGSRGAAALPVDGVRRENDVTLRFDVPGIDPASIEITVDKNVLSVSAKREEKLEENETFFVRERTMGTVTRRIHLSDRLNTEAIDAAYTNGVLEVTIPISERAKPRKVEIRKELVA